MPRALQNVMRTRGPFFGLDEKTDETILGPEYATDLNNVLLDKGRIEPRPGFKAILPLPATMNLPGGTSETTFITQMQVINGRRSGGGTTPEAYIVVVTRHGIWLLRSTNFPNQTVRQHLSEAGGVTLSNNDLWLRGSIVPFKDQMYFIFERPGRNYASTTPDANSDLIIRPVGIEAPTYAEWTLEPKSTDNPLPENMVPPWDSAFPEGTYDFRITWYDKDNDVESNATFVRRVVGNTGQVFADQRIILKVVEQARTPRATPATHVRIYAKIEELAFDNSDSDLQHGGSVTYRLIEEMAISSSDVRDSAPPSHFDANDFDAWDLYLDRDSLKIGEPHGSDPALSVAGDGPFSPTRNGVPPQANTAVVYSDSMVYASVESDSYGSILFSEAGRPEHVSPIDVITFEDAGREKTTGLFVYQGRLIIFKQNSIYIVAGVLTRKSNTNVALGQSTPAP